MTDLPERDDLLPPSAWATPLARAVAKTEGRLDDLDMDRVRRTRDVEVCSSAELDHLAAERSVDVYDPVWPIDVRRAVVRVAPLVHAHKGTPYGISTALEALKVDCRITEWWQTVPKGTPYTYEVRAFVRSRLYDGSILDARLVKAVFATVMRTNSHARAFDLAIFGVAEATLGLAPAAAGRNRVAGEAVAGLSIPAGRTTLGFAPAAAGRNHVAVAASTVLPIPPGRTTLGIAVVGTGRSRIAVAACAVRPAPPARSGIALAAAATARTRVSLVALAGTPS